jgi:hypothetical protein
MALRTRLRFPMALLAMAATCGLAACAGGGTVQRPAPPASQLSVPAPPPMTMIPPSPSFAVPPRPSSVGVRPVTATTHAVFFTGEASLGNGVYYLAFPNSNLFGYYSYLSDTHYVYHFDMSYEYVFDSSDANNVYFYDFQTGDFWYTGATLFPYVYDFTLQSFLYYYPDTQRAGHYTTNPRFFYNYQTSRIIQLPAPTIPLVLNLTITWANHGNSASSINVTLNAYDVNGHQLGHYLKSEVEAPPNTGTGIPSQNTDNLAVSYPQGQGATYQIIVNNPPTVPSPCNIANGSGSIDDSKSNNANAYPTVTLNCS